MLDKNQIIEENFKDFNKYLYWTGHCLLDIFPLPYDGWGYQTIWCDEGGGGGTFYNGYGPSDSSTSGDSSTSTNTGSDTSDSSDENYNTGDVDSTGGGGSTGSSGDDDYIKPVGINWSYQENILNALYNSGYYSIQAEGWVLEYPIEAKRLANFLLANNNSPEAEKFVGQFIKQTEITKLSFDINRSYKSPVNIDLTGINPDTPEGKLFLCIYDKLIQSASFKELFLNTFTQDNRVNVSIQIGDTPPNSNGSCQLVIIQNGNDLFYNNTIVINPAILKGTKSNFEIAKTIIHEFIHAYLNVLSTECANFCNTCILNEIDLPTIIDKFYQSGCSNNIPGTVNTHLCLTL